MFPWANGGSLRDFWKTRHKQSPTPELVKEAIIQLGGIADALRCLHCFTTQSSSDWEVRRDAENEDPSLPTMQLSGVSLQTRNSTEESIRHGDIKPENILRFKMPESPESIGTLKLADMGLAKQHINKTQDRTHITSTKDGTVRYEAPEADILGPRSRLYDIWSMGCIIFEFIIWILYGNHALEAFDKEMRDASQHNCQFFECRPGEPRSRQLHSVVKRWMDHIKITLSEPSAILDLLKIVRTKLLVVRLPSDTAITMPRTSSPPSPGTEQGAEVRATAEQLLNALNKLVEKTSTAPDKYWQFSRKLSPPSPPNISSGMVGTNYLDLPKHRDDRLPRKVRPEFVIT